MDWNPAENATPPLSGDAANKHMEECHAPEQETTWPIEM
jgi:hypothetical protein